MTGRRTAMLSIVAAHLAVACGHATTPAPAGPGIIQNGDIRLAYTVDLPPGTGPFPGVVLAHGSGRITRNDLRFLSTRFTAMGFAVLRFDKRGVGESTGTYSGVGPANSVRMFDELASDVAAAVRVMRARPDVDGRRVGLAGNSQAGWILPVAARQLGDAAFMVLLSGPVCTVGLENYYSELAEWSTRPLDEVYPLLPNFTGPDGFDPMPTLEQVNTPALWLLGDADRSIPVPTTVENLRRLQAQGRPFEWHVYHGLDHSLGPAIWEDVRPWLERVVRH